MTVAATALVLSLVWLVTAFPVRALLLRRRIGDAGFRPLSGRMGSAGWWGGVPFVAAAAIGLAATIAALAGLPALPGLDTPLSRPPAWRSPSSAVPDELRSVLEAAERLLAATGEAVALCPRFGTQAAR